MLSPEDKLIVDRYLDNSLTGIELSNFLSRLESDENFKKEVSFHNRMIEGIMEAEDRRLRQYVIDATGYRKHLVPFSLKLILTFLVITTGGIVFWQYIGPGSSGNKNFTFNFKKRSEQAEKPVTEIAVQTETQSVPATKPDREESKPAAGTTETDTVAPDIFVKKDQLLITHTLQPIELATAPETSMTASINSDPESGLPSNRNTSTYEVEFWVSPVNYKGYKLQGGKLILFGIEVPDEVQLYSIGPKMWMKYGNNFYDIKPGDNFEPLVESGNIPDEMK